MRKIKFVLSVMELAVKGPVNRRDAAYSNFTKNLRRIEWVVNSVYAVLM